MQLFILLLILLTPAGSESEDTSHQEICKPGQCYQILENALLSEPENLYKLQLAFSAAGKNHEVVSADRLGFTVCIHLTEETKHFVNFSADLEWCQRESCTSDGQTGCWRVSWSRSLLYGVVTRQLFGLDNTLAAVIYAAANQDMSSVVRYHSYIELYLNGSLPCSRTEASTLDEAVIMLASWFKAYGSAHSKPDFWKEENMGYITRYYDFHAVESTDSHNSLHIIRVVLLVSFVILNITAQLFVVILVPRYYCRVIKVIIKRGQHTVNSYWSLAIVAAVTNLLFFVSSFLFGVTFEFVTVVSRSCPIKSLCSNPTIYLDTKISYSVRIATMFIILLVDLLFAVQTLKYPYSCLPFCYCRCCCSSRIWSKVANIFAVWNILVFLQFHIMSVIPLCVLIMVSPTLTISAIAVYAIILLLCFVAMAHVLKMCRHRLCQKRANSGISNLCHFIIHLCAVLGSLLVILIVICTYSLLVRVTGAGRDTVPEFIWSFASSAALSLLVWYVKKRFLQKNSSSGTGTMHTYIPLQEVSTYDEAEAST